MPAFGRNKQERKDPELGFSRRPLLPTINTDESPQSPQGPGSSAATIVPISRSPQSYGATERTHSSPDRTRREGSTLNRVPEEAEQDGLLRLSIDDEGEDSELEEELALEEQGLYKGWKK